MAWMLSRSAGLQLSGGLFYSLTSPGQLLVPDGIDQVFLGREASAVSGLVGRYAASGRAHAVAAGDRAVLWQSLRDAADDLLRRRGDT